MANGNLLRVQHGQRQPPSCAPWLVVRKHTQNPAQDLAPDFAWVGCDPLEARVGDELIAEYFPCR